MRFSSLIRGLPIAVLILAALACSAPIGQGAAASTQPAEAATAAPSATEAATPAPTEAVTPAAAAGPAANVTFGGVSFYLDPTLGTATGKQVPADTGDTGSPGMPLPARVQFDISGYPAGKNVRLAQIVIVPVSAPGGAGDAVAQREALLKQLLQQKPGEDAISQDIPQLADMAQGEMVRVKVKYLDFQNGSGVRFVTEFSSDVRPVSQSDIVYVFQGLTADGSTIVSVQLPLTQPALPAGPDSMTADQLNALAANFDQYVKDTTKALDAADDSSYQPGLATLDGLAQSFMAQGVK